MFSYGLCCNAAFEQVYTTKEDTSCHDMSTVPTQERFTGFYARSTDQMPKLFFVSY